MAHQPPSTPDPGSNSDAGAPFAIVHLDGCAVVLAAGEIDLRTSPALREVLADAAEASDRIILDMTRVTFLDSTGMGVMVGARNQDHHRQGHTLCLVGPWGTARRALEITGLTTVFPIYASVDDAVCAAGLTLPV